MRTDALAGHQRNRARHQHALTLIEMIGVLAIIALSAAVLVPSFIRQMDKVAADQETVALKAMADGLQANITRNRYVPGPSDWSSVIAGEVGLNISAVSTNARRQPRYFLIDPNLRLGTNGGATLPYRQDVRGSVQPISPRVLLLSSIGPALASAPTNADFDNIWQWTDDSVSPPTNAAFSTLRRGTDLKVQRIHLGSLFVHLLLTTNTSADQAYYSISTNAVNSQTGLVPTNWIDGYFFRGSVLGLYTNNGTGPVDSRQILTRDGSFVYEGGVWRNELIGPALSTSAVGGGSMGIMASAYSIVTNFLAAPPNTGAGASNQQGVVLAMINYMTAYDAWAGSNFTNSTLYTTAVSNQSVLTKAVDGLCCNPIPPEYKP
jgi:type II secretory pathway pseudopilin PulG